MKSKDIVMMLLAVVIGSIGGAQSESDGSSGLELQLNSALKGREG